MPRHVLASKDGRELDHLVPGSRFAPVRLGPTTTSVTQVTRDITILLCVRSLDTSTLGAEPVQVVRSSAPRGVTAAPWPASVHSGCTRTLSDVNPSSSRGPIGRPMGDARDDRDETDRVLGAQ